MKKLILLLVLLNFVNAVNCQNNLDGLWAGVIYDSNEEPVLGLYLSIDGDEVVQYHFDSDTEEYYENTSFKVQEFSQVKNSGLYYWINNSEIWTEVHSYHLSLLNDHEAKVIWTRQVNNIQDGQDNDIWSVSGGGTIQKVSYNLFEDPFVEAQSFSYLKIKSVSINDNATMVVMDWENSGTEAFTGTFGAPASDNAMYITDRNRINKYKLESIEGVAGGSPKTLQPGESVEVSLYFESIGELREFDIIEPGTPGNTWNFYGIVLE